MMINKMIVTIKDENESSISLRLFDREKRRSQRFFISKQLIEEDLVHNGYMSDVDFNNTLRMSRKKNGIISCHLNFINIDYRNNITGYRRCFDVPLSAFEAALNGETSKILVDFEEPEHTPQFTLSDIVHKCVAQMDKTKRHAFVKGLLRNFHAKGEVKIFKDFDDDFYFQEIYSDYGSMSYGGLCFHEETYRGHEKLVYSKHS